MSYIEYHIEKSKSKETIISSLISYVSLKETLKLIVDILRDFLRRSEIHKTWIERDFRGVAIKFVKY